MDNLTHSLVGLAVAKSGLERLSPYATTVCLIAANAPDIDSASIFFGDRWTLLQHHRAITHSIIGTLVLALVIPAGFSAIEKLIMRRRKQPSRIRFRGLMVASTIALITHPILDWTNNYGVRPFLPWSSKWFYGDLAFVVDPYIWLGLGGVVFLLTSQSWPRILLWLIVGSGASALVLLVTVPRGVEASALGTLRVIWIVAVILLVATRAFRFHQSLGSAVVLGVLACLLIYFGGLWFAHRAAYANALTEAKHLTSSRREHFLRLAAMPVVANPFRWQCVLETDQAFYRYYVGIADEPLTGGNADHDVLGLERFQKPAIRNTELISLAEQDRRARVLLGFARFPIAQIVGDDCVGQSLVQFADLRYTEPGVARSGFAVAVPVECPAR